MSSLLDRRVILAAAALCAAALFLVPIDTEACSLAGPTPHEVVPDPADTVAPLAPTVRVLSLERGSSGGCGEQSSCDDIGFLSLSVETSDDVSPMEEIGFRVSIEAGSLPGGANPLDSTVL